MLWGLFNKKKRGELHELQLKSHFVKGLEAYMFCSFDVVAVITKEYPECNIFLPNMAMTVEAQLNAIHACMTHYKNVAQAYSKTEIVVPLREELNSLPYTKEDDYKAAAEYIANAIRYVTEGLKKKLLSGEVTIEELRSRGAEK